MLFVLACLLCVDALLCVVLCCCCVFLLLCAMLLFCCCVCGGCVQGLSAGPPSAGPSLRRRLWPTLQTDFGHPYFPTLAKSDFGQNRLWPILVFWCFTHRGSTLLGSTQKGGAPRVEPRWVGRAKPRKSGAPKGGAPKGGDQKGGD